MWRWLRRLVRRHTRPVPLSTAEKWDRRLSILYNLLAWNAGGLVLYMIFTGQAKKWAEEHGLEEDKRLPSEKFADILGVKKAHVIHMSGFRVVREFDIDKTKDETVTTDSEVLSEDSTQNVSA